MDPRLALALSAATFVAAPVDASVEVASGFTAVAAAHAVSAGEVTMSGTPVSGDTIPRLTQVQSRTMDVLPTGLSYDEMRHSLSRLTPIPQSPAAVPGGPDGGLWREIDGLVVDETQSKIGQDFYQVFYSAWEAPRQARNFTIRIQEQPSPSLGTRVLVLLDDEMLFQLQLQPRYDTIEELAQQAALYTRRELEMRQPESLPAAAGDPDAQVEQIEQLEQVEPTGQDPPSP